MIRQQVWTNAWCAVANSPDCQEHELATNWADACLTAFDQRFQPKEVDTPSGKKPPLSSRSRLGLNDITQQNIQTSDDPFAGIPLNNMI